jgi:thiol-disulfide isomerase/thioredoxin
MASARNETDCRRSAIRTSSIALALSLAQACSASAAGQAPDEVVRLVRDRIAANYAPVKTIQAKVVEVVVNPGVKEETRIEPDNVDGVGLSFTLSPRFEIKWSATIAGPNERYEIGDPGSEYSETLLRRGNLELQYDTGGQNVWLGRFDPQRCRSVQYDPRESVSMGRGDSLAALLAYDVRRAEITTKRGQRVARIELAGPADYLYVLDCPESANFLPTQLYQICGSPDPKLKGIVVNGVSVEYYRCVLGLKTVLFPKRIVSNNAAEPVRSTVGYMQLPGDQTTTVIVKELKLNAPLARNAFVAPAIPADARFSVDTGDDLSEVPAELRERVAKEQREMRESLDEVKRILQPVEDMVGKLGPALPAQGWVGGQRPDLAGKPYLLAFWSTSCGPCKNDLPTLRDMAGTGTQIVGMHPFGTPADEVAEFINLRKLGYPTLLGQEEAELVGGYPAVLFPHYILVDAQGMVVAHGHLTEMATKLDELSGENANQATAAPIIVTATGTLRTLP